MTDERPIEPPGAARPLDNDASASEPEDQQDVAAASPVIESPTEDAVGTQGMIPGRIRRRTMFERVSMRILATGGIVGLDVALGAILGANHVRGWIDGLVIGLASVLLAAVLWSSRQL
jgi:hypothetical protein